MADKEMCKGTKKDGTKCCRTGPWCHQHRTQRTKKKCSVCCKRIVCDDAEGELCQVCLDRWDDISWEDTKKILRARRKNGQDESDDESSDEDDEEYEY